MEERLTIVNPGRLLPAHPGPDFSTASLGDGPPTKSTLMLEESRWRPQCGLDTLRKRARLNAKIRAFFAARDVLEVETPVMGACGVTDPLLHPFTTVFTLPGQRESRRLYLQTSPEFAMKRMLAAGSGSIYQITKAFRNDEVGRHHNPEFTLLEWYRVGFSLPDLMAEVESLIAELASGERDLLTPERLSYVDAFTLALGLHPLEAGFAELARVAEARGMPEAAELCGRDRPIWLDLLFSHWVQPGLGRRRLTSVYHYPACLPSLARRCEDDARFVERVEIFLEGVELGNGFHELADPREQRQRFESDLEQRRAMDLPEPAIDRRLLDALRVGLPDCSGIAIGLDRLLMALIGGESLADALAFPIERA